MSKKWYNYFVSVDDQGDQSPADESDPGSQGPQSQQSSAAQAVADIAASVQITPKFAPPVAGGPPTTFDEIYKAAEIQTPSHGFTVFKVADMLQSGHIKDLPAEIKRSSVLLALEA